MLIITLDREDNGSASAITADVLAVRWRIGMAARYDAVSVPARAEIVLNNRTGEYSPERSAALVGKWVTIADATRTYFAGIIRQVEPFAGDYGHQQARLIAEGREAELAQQTIHLPALVGVSSGAVIAALLDRVRLRRRVLAGFCIIDAAGNNLIDSASIFPPYDDGRVLEDGKTVFALLAERALPALDLIRRVVRAEGGRFFFTRTGEARFVDRHHLLRDDTIAATFSDNMRGLSVQYGDDLVNQIHVRLIPRTVGAENSLLWNLPDVRAIGRGAVHQIRAAYTLDNQPVQALSIRQPQRGVDFEATVLAGGGADASADLSVRMLEAGADSALLEIRNYSTATRYLQRLELRGTPLITGNPLTLERVDRISAIWNGVRTVTIDMEEPGSLAEIEALAETEMLRRSQVRGRVHSMELDGREHAAALALTLLDRVRISETQTGHSAAYTIIAEQHEVTLGGTRHQLTWLLEPADSERFFVVDTHAPDGERILFPR